MQQASNLISEIYVVKYFTSEQVAVLTTRDTKESKEGANENGSDAGRKWRVLKQQFSFFVINSLIAGQLHNPPLRSPD